MPVNVKFYNELRKPLHGKPALFALYTQKQVDALNAIVAVFDSFAGHDHCADDLAYIMATCYRECGSGLNLAIEEVGHGARKEYGLPAGPYGKKYYGRGPTQETWLHNYQTAKLATGIDFVQFPEYMCIPAHGLVAMMQGMYAGRYTRRSLRTYIQPSRPTTFEAFKLCRHIINGTDHDAEVAFYALAFQSALIVGYSVPEVKALPATAPQSQPRLSLWAALVHMFGGK